MHTRLHLHRLTPKNRKLAESHQNAFFFPYEGYNETSFLEKLHSIRPAVDCYDFKMCTAPAKPIYAGMFTHGSYKLQMETFYSEWWAMSNVDTYIQWSMRSIGSYNRHLFV